MLVAPVEHPEQGLGLAPSLIDRQPQMGHQHANDFSLERNLGINHAAGLPASHADVVQSRRPDLTTGQ
jgi:hypothetical protein